MNAPKPRPVTSALVALLAITVIDGSTINLDGEQIRIMGLDAPEADHAKCPSEALLGLMAKKRLEALLKGYQLTVERHAKDSDDRTQAKVFVDGEDVAGIMIREGLAHEYHGGQHRDWCR